MKKLLLTLAPMIIGRVLRHQRQKQARGTVQHPTRRR
jgi:hypothetical protein